LVKGDESELFMQKIKKEYYEGYLKSHKPDLMKSQVDLKEAIFPCRVSQGAGVLFE